MSAEAGPGPSSGRATPRRLIGLAAAVMGAGALLAFALTRPGGDDSRLTDTDGSVAPSTVAGAGTERPADDDSSGSVVAAGPTITGGDGIEDAATVVTGDDGVTSTTAAPPATDAAGSPLPTGGPLPTGTTAPGGAVATSGAPTSPQPLATVPAPAGAVSIAAPQSNDVVASTLSVEGSAGALTAGHELWLLVRPLQEESYVVQGDGPVRVVDGAWQGSVTVGDGTAAARGQRYLIYVVDVDQAAADVLRSKAVGATRSGIALPPGATKAAAVMVQLQS